MFDSYFEAVKKLNNTINAAKASYMSTANTAKKDLAFFLGRTQHLFDRMGNPEKSGFKYVHIAGTSGKGSTSAMIYNALVADGKNVGLYMSPYVTTAAENIQANGQLIDPALFVECVDEVLPIANAIAEEDPELRPSYSDIFFAIGFMYFKRIGVEWLVIETSCGGRFDKTNIIPAPEVAVITPIGIDHVAILGDTIEKIAYQKAGIIKSGSTVFSSGQKAETTTVLQQQADEVGGIIKTVTTEYTGKLSMPGKHQRLNAGVAEAACMQLDISSEAIATGFAKAQLPARVEIMQDSPLVVLDGAHSKPKIVALVETLEEMKAEKPWNKLHMLYSAKEGKDLEAIISQLAPIADTVTVTGWQLPGFGSANIQEMATLFSKHGNAEVTIHEQSRDALETVLAQAKNDDIVVLTGSLYLAGELRQHWISVEQMLTERSLFPTR